MNKVEQTIRAWDNVVRTTWRNGKPSTKRFEARYDAIMSAAENGTDTAAVKSDRDLIIEVDGVQVTDEQQAIDYVKARTALGTLGAILADPTGYGIATDARDRKYFATKFGVRA